MVSKKNRYIFIKVISRASFVLTAIILSLLILEIGIRISSFKPSLSEIKRWGWLVDSERSLYALDKYRVYKLNPKLNSSENSKWGSDSEGFRYNPNHVGKEREDYQNIVIIGDSFTYGHGVNLNEAFPYLLEQKLNSLGRNVWIDNAGIPGYGFDQEFVYLKDEILPKFDPDTVIWAVNFNDFGDSNDACLFKKVGDKYLQLSGKLNSLYFKKGYYPKLPKAIRHSYLFHFLDEKIPERYTIGCSRKVVSEVEIAEKVEYFFKEIKSLSKEKNFDFLISIVLNQHYFVDNPGVENWEEKVFWIQKQASFLTNVAKNLNVPIVDTNTRYAYNSGSETKVLGYYMSIDTEQDDLFLEEKKFDVGWKHINKDGNELMSELVADALETWILKP